MGKSIRSKIKKRLRTVKRQRADAMIYTPQTQEHYESLQRVIQGRSVTLSKPKNAFKYPEKPGAVFPQRTLMKPIDYRAENLPMAGYVFRGNRRKYNKDEQEHLQNIIKTHHPKMEVLAGGGAILASTGQRISEKEAEILATSVERPEDAAIAVAGASNSSSAVAAAVAEDSAKAASSGSQPPAGDEEMEAEPDNAADHSRRPIFKDDRRSKRAAEHRPRANSVKKNNLKVKSNRFVEEEAAPKAKAPAEAPKAPAATQVPTAAAAAVSTDAPATSSSPGAKKKKGARNKKTAMETDTA